MLSRFAQNAPILIVNVLNFTIPNVTLLLVRFEKWDYPETSTKQETLRNFFIKLINLSMMLYSQYKGVIRFTDFTYSDEQALKMQEEYHGPLECVYDSVGQNLFKLIYQQMLIFIVVEFMKGQARKCLMGRLFNKSEWKAPLHKYLSSFNIQILYQKTLHWILLMNSPYFAFVSPILDYINFQVLHYIISNYYS